MSLREETQKASDKKNEQLDNIKIALIGRGGAGKSALINAIVDEDICETGVHTDTTIYASEPIIHGEMSFVDLPGYGTSGFPKEEWEDKFKPTQYDMLIHVVDGKLTADDEEFGVKIRKEKVNIIVVRTKDDQLKGSSKKGITEEDLRNTIRKDISSSYGNGIKVLFTGHGDDESDVYGIGPLNNEIKANLTTAKKFSFERWSRAYTKEQLEKKTKSAYRMVHEKAILSGIANAVPVVGIAADLKIQLDLGNEIKSIFGIKEENVDSFVEKYGAYIKPLFKEVIRFGSQEALIKTGTKFVTKKAAIEFFNKVPFLGTLVAASIGATMTELLGFYMVKQASQLAEYILKEELKG